MYKKWLSAHSGHGNQAVLTCGSGPPVPAIGVVRRQSFRFGRDPPFSPSMPSLPARRLKVLIVDDDVNTVMLLEAMLEDAGYAVRTRTQVIGTSSSILRDEPDIILLDIDMPALRGDQLANLIAQDPRLSGPSLVVHSSLPKSQLEKIAADVGAVGYIAKVADHRSFLRSFEEMVRRHRARPPVSRTRAE